MSASATTHLGMPASPRRIFLVSAVFGLLWRLVLLFQGMVERHWQNIMTAFVQIWSNRARSFLTTLGIIIAVTSTITVVSMVQGFGNYVTDMLRGFGTNMIFVIPRMPSGMRGAMLGRTSMNIDDIRSVGARCDKVRRITPLMFLRATVEYGREKVDNVNTVMSQPRLDWISDMPLRTIRVSAQESCRDGRNISSLQSLQ